MAEVKPLKLTALGGGAGKLEEFGAGDTVPVGSLPALLAYLNGANTWTANQLIHNGSGYVALTVKRQEQSGAGNTDQAIVDVQTGTGAARFAHNNPGSATTNAIVIKRDGTVWFNGYKLFHQGNILGTVSQSAGVPTGAVIEEGSNANGTYIRYADGTQICRGSTGTITIAATANTTQAITYPAAFTAAPYTFANIRSTLPDRFRTAASQTSGNAGTVAVYNSGASTSGLIDWIAIGRWY